MSYTSSCKTCGNECDAGLPVCPYCGAKKEGLAPKKERQHCVVNLKRGMPPVKDALHKMDQDLTQARVAGFRVVTLIHGYGSSGRGGLIRDAVRRRLAFLKDKGQINDVLAGEQFSRTGSHARHLLRRFPFLASHGDLGRTNRGITLVVL